MDRLMMKSGIPGKFPCFGAAPGGTVKGGVDLKSRIKKEYDQIDESSRRKLMEFFEDDMKFYDYSWNVTNNEINWND